MTIIDTEAPPTGEQVPAFDATVYDLDVPTLDGHRSDTIIVGIGSIALDRTDVDDLELVNDTLHLGAEVELKVRARVVRKGMRNVIQADGVSNEFSVGLRVLSIEAA